MEIIKRLQRRLTKDEEPTYIHSEEAGGEVASVAAIAQIEGAILAAPTLASSSSFVSPTLYRVEQKERIVAVLLANSSLLVVGEPGCGKTTLGDVVAFELAEDGFPLAKVNPTTPKQILLSIAKQLDATPMEALEGKALTVAGLMQGIAEFLSENVAFLIFDDAHRLPSQIRYWLEELHRSGQPMLLLASHPRADDIFLKLPRIELKPLTNRQIREIMHSSAVELGLELSDAEFAFLQQRCGGNPLLAKRVVREEYLGLDETSPDHTQWIDGTPFVIAGLMIFTVVRFLGLGLNSPSLYLLGGVLTVAVGIVQILLFSLPKKSARLGR